MASVAAALVTKRWTSGPETNSGGIEVSTSAGAVGLA